MVTQKSQKSQKFISHTEIAESTETKRAAGIITTRAARPFKIYYYEHNSLFECEFRLLAVAVVFTAEVGVVTLAQELGDFFVRPVPCLAADGGSLLAEINAHGTATSFVVLQVVLHVIRQQRARPSEVLSVLFVEEENLILTTRENNSLFHIR